MKKSYFFLLLLSMLYCIQGSATVMLGKQISASDIKDGSLIAISGTKVNATFTATDWEGYYLTNTENASKTFSALTVWKVVYKGTTDTDGNSEFYLVNYSDNKYLGAISPDGSKWGGFKTTVIDSARTFTVKTYEGSMKNEHISDKTVVMPTLIPGWPEQSRSQCLSLSPNGLDKVRCTYDLINFLSDDKSENGTPLNVYAVSEKQDDPVDNNSASNWKYTEVDGEKCIAITIHSGIQIVCLPFSVSNFSNINEEVRAFAIKQIFKEENTSESSIECYEKETFSAGEPFIVVYGDTAQREIDTISLIVPAPDASEFTNTPGKANGLVGTFSATTVGAGKGKAYPNAILATQGASTYIEANSGYIDLGRSVYTGEVEGVKTAFIFLVDSLNWPKRYLGDGVVNIADIVATYYYMNNGELDEFQLAPDVNGDGILNRADVAAIYNYIANGEATGLSLYQTDVYNAENNTSVGDYESNVIEMKVGSTTDLTKVPLTISLDNSSIHASAFETYIRGINPSSFVYDDGNEDFTYKRGSLLNSKHDVIVLGHTARYYDDALYISITGENNPTFSGADNNLITLYFDASNMSEGNQSLELIDSKAASTNGKEISLYTIFPVVTSFIIKDGMVIGADGEPTDTVRTDTTKTDTTTVITKPEFSLVGANISVSKGAQVELPIVLTNVDEIRDLQFDLYLPEGISIATDENGEALISVAADRSSASSHQINYKQQSDGSLRILCTSPTGIAFTGDSGKVVNITLNVDAATGAGDYEIALKNVVVSNADSTYYLPGSTSQLNVESHTLGDINDDGEINVGDLSRLVYMVLHNYSIIDDTFLSADINGDGKLNVGDYSKLVQIILKEE